MNTLLLCFGVPFLLCFGSVFVCANGGNTTRMTIFEASKDVRISVEAIDKYRDYVYSYRYPTLAEIEGVVVAVAEARFDHYMSGYSGEVLVKYITERGKWKTMVAIPRNKNFYYARSVNPTVVQHKKNLLIFAERFEEWTYDWTDYKSGNGDFVRSLLNGITTRMGNSRKMVLKVDKPSSLIPELSSDLQGLQLTRLIGGFGRGIEVNQTTIVPVVLIKNTKQYSSVLLSGSSNWKLSQGTGDEGTLESAIVEWEGKLIMNSRTDDGYRKVYESTDMGKTWKESLGSLSRVWGNAPNRQGYGCSASFISVNIEETPVMLFSHPLNTKGEWNRDQLHLWLTDNKRIYDVGQISENADNTGHSSLLYTKESLFCVYEKERYGTTYYYSSVLVHLVDELKKIKDVVKKWKNQDKAFSESCDGKDSSPSYPGSTCEVHIPQNGLVGFLSNEATTTHWKDAYSCVDAEITHGVKVKNGIKFNAKGAGAMWPVGKQGQNQRYHFMNHEFTLAATVIIHECTDTGTTHLLSVILDTNDRRPLVSGECRGKGSPLITEHEVKDGQITFSNDKQIRLAITFQKGVVRLYMDGKTITDRKPAFASGLLSTPISHICILQCGENKLKEHAQVTVQNVLLYNRVLSKEEIDLLYLPIIPTKTPTISKTTSYTNSLSKTLSTTETPSRSLSHTTTQSLSHTLSQSQSLSRTSSESQSLSHTVSESQSLSHTLSQSQSLSHTLSESQSLSHTLSESQSLSHTLSESQSLSHTVSESQSLSHTVSKSQSLSHTLSESQSLSHTLSESQSLSHTVSKSQSLSHTVSESQSLSHTYDVIRERSQKGMKRGSSFKREQDMYSDGQPKSSESTQIPMKTSDAVCPSIIVETFPAGDLTQKDIDGLNVGKRILLVSLPKRFYWPNSNDVGSLISFSGGSGADHPNGFSGKWGEMLRNVTWSRSTTNPRSVLKAEIPTYINYDIVSDEEIVIYVDARALSVDCQGPLKGSFTIHAKNASQVVKDSKAFDSDISSKATVTNFFAGGAGSILEIQALSLLSRMNCAPKEESYMFNFLPYLTSIFVNFGSLWIVLGNAMIVVIFGFIHYCFTVVYKQMRGGDSSKACSRMFFPSFTYFVAYMMHIGIFVHSVSLLFMLKAEWNHYFVGIVGTSYGLIFPLFVLYYVAYYIEIQLVPYPHFINQSCFKRWMSPHGYWTPRNQVKMYGSIFFTIKDKYLYFCVFRLSVVCIAGIVTIIPTTTENCHIQYFCLMGIFLFGSIVTAVANMMRSVFLTSMHTLSFFLLATLCFISGLNYVSPNKMTFNAYFLFTVMLLVVVFITLIYKACLLFYDWMYVTNDAMGSTEIKEPFTEGMCEKDLIKGNNLPYGKEDPFVLMQSENGNEIRNEPYGK